jgi:CBS-domain-containing membrane protein
LLIIDSGAIGIGRRSCDRPSSRAVLRRLHRRLDPLARIGVGVFLSALALAGVGMAIGTPLLLAPFAATATLKHAVPDSPRVTPRAVLGGHLIGASVGMVVGALLGEAALGVALAAAVSTVLMVGLGMLHAPAVATTVVALHAHGDHWFPVQVALVAAATLIVTTMVLSPLLHQRPYPVRG